VSWSWKSSRTWERIIKRVLENRRT